MRFPGFLGLAMVAAACVSGGANVDDPVPTLFDDSTSTIGAASVEVSSSTITTTVPLAERLPVLADEVAGAVRSADGTLLAVTGSDGDVWFVVGPCGGDQIEPGATAVLVGAQHVVLDPGGNDDEAARINLAVAERAAALLESDGVAVALTRTQQAVLAAETRGVAGPAVGARVFVSIEHPSAGDTEGVEARPTVFHRADDPQSRRLAGLIHEEVVAAFVDFGQSFVAHDEPGVRSLLNQRGEDYFRVLQTTGTVSGARVELLALDENATTLLATEEGRAIEAQALADAIVRFLVTEEEGNGFIDPIEAVRTAPTSNAPGGCG